MAAKLDWAHVRLEEFIKRYKGKDIKNEYTFIDLNQKIWESQRERERLAASKLESRRTFNWPAQVPTYNTDEGELSFVNCDQAIKKLLAIFSNNDRRKGGSCAMVGNSFRVGLIDEVYGVAETTFALNFIDKCSKISLDDEPMIATLADAKTLYVSLKSKDELTTAIPKSPAYRCACANVVIGEIFRSLSKIDPITTEELLAEFEQLSRTRRTSDYLLNCVRERSENEPIFVVLDEVDRLFGEASECCGDFITFFGKVLNPWLCEIGIYFIILGKSHIFEDLGYYRMGIEFIRLPLDV